MEQVISMGELTNCPECGKVFVKTPTRVVCDTCYKEDLKKLDIVLNFLKRRTSREASLEEVEEGTGVPIEVIERFIKMGKIRINSFPNLGYPCKQCGIRIREGTLCGTCLSNLTGKVEKSESVKRAEEEVKERIRKSEQATYFLKED